MNLLTIVRFSQPTSMFCVGLFTSLVLKRHGAKQLSAHNIYVERECAGK